LHVFNGKINDEASVVIVGTGVNKFVGEARSSIDCAKTHNGKGCFIKKRYHRKLEIHCVHHSLQI